MTGPEVLTIRQKLGLSQLELAERLGTSERTVRRWEAEGAPEVIARFLKSMVSE
jgi:DNA-binding transcriptional regulator YiaG